MWYKSLGDVKEENQLSNEIKIIMCWKICYRYQENKSWISETLPVKTFYGYGHHKTISNLNWN